MHGDQSTRSCDATQLHACSHAAWPPQHATAREPRRVLPPDPAGACCGDGRHAGWECTTGGAVVRCQAAAARQSSRAVRSHMQQQQQQQAHRHSSIRVQQPQGRRGAQQKAPNTQHYLLLDRAADTKVNKSRRCCSCCSRKCCKWSGLVMLLLAIAGGVLCYQFRGRIQLWWRTHIEHRAVDGTVHCKDNCNGRGDCVRGKCVCHTKMVDGTYGPFGYTGAACEEPCGTAQWRAGTSFTNPDGHKIDQSQALCFCQQKLAKSGLRHADPAKMKSTATDTTLQATDDTYSCGASGEKICQNVFMACRGLDAITCVFGINVCPHQLL
jgi:hypothetical protein